MIEITDRMRVLLKEAFEKRGGVIKNMGFFRKKRPTIYLWLNGTTRSVDEYIFISIMRFIEPFMTEKDRIELGRREKIARMALIINTPVEENQKSDEYLEVIKTHWKELTVADKSEVLYHVLYLKNNNSKIRFESEKEKAHGEYLREKYEAEQRKKQQEEGKKTETPQ